MSAKTGRKAIFAALSANLGLAATKFIAFLMTGSSAMLAESVHSVADSGNQVLLLIGGHRARREETDRHPFGYARARYYYAFLVAVVLFTVGGLFAMTEAWHKYSHPEPITSWQWIPLAVLGVGFLLESLSFRIAIREANLVRGSLGWVSFIRRSKSPELPVILLEDLAALVGLAFAACGVGLTLVTGDGRWDAAGTAAIGLLLVVVAVILGIETKSMLMGESASPEDLERVRAALAQSNLGDVVHLRTMHLGPDDLLVVAKVTLPGTTRLKDAAALVDEAEARIRADVPAARLIYLETDVRRKGAHVTDLDFIVLDLGLAAAGRHQIDLAEHEMPGLMALREEFAAAQPLAGARIAGSLHMTVQTAVLIETLAALGADIRWASCNVFSTQDEAAAAVALGKGTIDAPAGVPVFAVKGESVEEYWEYTDRILTWEGSDGPTLIVDDGGDATLLVHEGVAAEAAGSVPARLDPEDEGYHRETEAMRAILRRSLAADPGRFTRMAAGIVGVSEETTTGVGRLTRLHERGRPPLPGDQCQRFGHQVEVRQPVRDPSLASGRPQSGDGRAHRRQGRCVAGYGDVGKGAAEALRGQGARVIVTEVDPICALQAAMDGYQVARLDDVVADADFFITSTGGRDVVTLSHLKAMKDKAIVGNIGHFDDEIDMAGLAASEAKRVPVKPQVDEWVFPDGHSVFVLSEGRLLNLGNATGHPSFVMSTSFSNQVLAQIELWTKRDSYPVGVHRLPKVLDEKVARLHLDALGVDLTTLTPEQADYIGVSVEGPYKPDHYRY